VRKIIVGQRVCQIEEHDHDIIKKLDRELSFFIQGAEHSKAYVGYIDPNGKTVTWDGRKHLLSNSLKFSPGLLSRVKNFYDKKNIPYELVNHLPQQSPTNKIDIQNRLVELGKIPYPYQLEAVEAVKNNHLGIIKIATGGGKSLVAAMITAEFGKRTIIFVIGKDLLYQMHELFEAVFQQKIGIIGDGKCEIADINIATIWTVNQALGLKKIKKAEDESEERDISTDKYDEIKEAVINSKLAIIDECHLAASDTIQSICGCLNVEKIYGMSASPIRDDGADLLIENVLGNKIIDISAKQLIESGHLVNPVIRFLPVPPYTGKKAPYKTIYQDYIVNNVERNNMVCLAAQKLVEQGFQTLVLFHSIKHGKLLYDQIKKKIPCELLSGEDDIEVRNKVKKKLEKGKINCIVASKIFDIGVDLPSLSSLICAGGGKSSVRALQRIGRVIRLHESKTMAAIIDFSDQAPYLSDHSEIRRKIYEEEFKDVQWPKEQTKK
jgi:superfamily II DNA or RNA helicase